MFRTKLKDGMLYLTDAQLGYFEPEWVTLFWKTEAPADPQLDNLEVQMMGAAYYVTAYGGRRISVNPTEIYPSHKEVMKMTPPSKKHVWKNGEWRKK